MYPVKLVVRWSGTHDSLAPDTSQIARPIELLDFLGQRQVYGVFWAYLK
jgi:hypothetical protein